MATKIEWTEETWNPIAGCSLVSPGCTSCYAMGMAARIQRMNKGRPSHYDGTTKTVNGKPVWTGKVNVAPDHIFLAPLTWKKPKRIFVNSMSDLFHEDVPDDVIDKVFAVVALSPQHTFQVLTKRSKRMREYFATKDRDEGIGRRGWEVIERQGKLSGDQSSILAGLVHGGGPHRLRANQHLPDHAHAWPLPNVCLGVSCEDQTRANERIPDLLTTPAAVRFVSAEPLLGPIDFTNLDYECGRYIDAIAGTIWTPGAGSENSFTTNCRKLDQIITGGESGPDHRPMQIEWAEAIRQQCRRAGTAFFFKQDSGPCAGLRGRANDALWACKQMPEAA